MKNNYLKSKCINFALLLASMLVLIWRVIDFSYETVYGFGITRGGFVFKGIDAVIIETLIIIGCIVLIWKFIINITRLHKTNHTD